MRKQQMHVEHWKLHLFFPVDFDHKYHPVKNAVEQVDVKKQSVLDL